MEVEELLGHASSANIIQEIVVLATTRGNREATAGLLQKVTKLNIPITLVFTKDVDAAKMIEAYPMISWVQEVNTIGATTRDVWAIVNDVLCTKHPM
jgi:hypothetical protein